MGTAEYCAVLCCAVLCCAVLCCVVLELPTSAGSIAGCCVFLLFVAWPISNVHAWARHLWAVWQQAKVLQLAVVCCSEVQPLTLTGLYLLYCPCFDHSSALAYLSWHVEHL
jgi:hypothetical protein